MKLEHYIFLSLVLMAAIITGSTLCVASNLPHILVQAEQAQQVQSALSDRTAYNSATANTPYTPSAISRGSVSSTDVMVITAAEKEQIVNMLKNLGMRNEDEMPSFIKGFQEKHALDATGLLDSKTLYFIIQESKLVRVDQPS